LLRQVENEYGKDFFLFVGVLRQYKGLNILLEAMRGAPYKAVIAGIGPLEKTLKRQAKRLTLDNVSFPGYISDELKIALLTLCRGIVLPSYLRSEAFGVFLLEGAMMSKPLISAEIGSGTNYININEHTGLTVAPESPPNRVSNCAFKAGPPSPENPGAPVPATVRMIPSGVILRMR